MVPNHGTQYKENQISHHGGMQKDRRMDGLTDGPVPIFPDSAITEQGIAILVDN